jgi:hypothetical protein
MVHSVKLEAGTGWMRPETERIMTERSNTARTYLFADVPMLGPLLLEMKKRVWGARIYDYGP